MFSDAKFVGKAVDEDGYIHNLFFRGENGKGDIFYVDELGVNIFSSIPVTYQPEMDGSSRDVNCVLLGQKIDNIMESTDSYNVVAKVVSENPQVEFIAITFAGNAVLLDAEGNEAGNLSGTYFTDNIDAEDADAGPYIEANDLF